MDTDFFNYILERMKLSMYIPQIILYNFNLLLPLMNFLVKITDIWDKNKERFGEKRFYPCLLAVLIILGFIPLLYPSVPAGHDIGFHWARIFAIYENLQCGYFPARINLHAFEGFGYATSFFYAELFLYPIALLMLLGVPLIVAYKLFLVIWGIGTAFSMYYVVLRIGRSYFGAFAGALLYCWSSYFAVDIFIRAALGEVQAFLFLPWCLLGIYEVILGNPRRIFPLVFGFAGLFYSHNIAFVLMTLATLIILILNLPAFLKDIKRIAAVVIAGTLALLLALGQLVPMLEQLTMLKFNLTGISAEGSLADRMVPLTRIFLELPYMKMKYWLPPGIGVIFLVVLVQRVRVASYHSIIERFRDILLIGGLASLVCSTDFLPWEGMMSKLSLIQFPWRLYILATAMLACGGGLLLGALPGMTEPDRQRRWTYILLFGCGFAWFFNVSYSYVAKIHDKNMFYHFSREDGHKYIASGFHYLPQGKYPEHYVGRRSQVSFSRKPREYKVTYPKPGILKLEVEGIKEDTVVEFPIIPYIGYKVETEGYSDSVILDFTGGDFKVHMKKAADEVTFKVYYALTKKQFISMLASVLTLISILAYILMQRNSFRRIEKTIRQ